MVETREVRRAHVEACIAGLMLAAKRTEAKTVKIRARVFLSRPETRDRIAPGLWCASSECLIATGLTALDNARRFPRQYFEVDAITEETLARALVLVGRYERRFWHRIGRGGFAAES